MRLTHLLFILMFCLTPMLGCGGGGDSGPGAPVSNQSELDKFLAENPELNSDEANEDTVGEDEDEE